VHSIVRPKPSGKEIFRRPLFFLRWPCQLVPNARLDGKLHLQARVAFPDDSLDLAGPQRLIFVFPIRQGSGAIRREATETMMARLRKRLRRIEDEVRFKRWVRFQRWLETLDVEQLEDFAINGIYPEPFPNPPPGSTRLDKLGRRSLIRLWDETQRCFEGRTSQELEVYPVHGRWPEDSH
jgi:hypothetical protein